MRSSPWAIRRLQPKRAGLDELTSVMKAVLHYAEDVVHGNDVKLAALGWSGKALEYRVIATNKAGESVPSNTVAMVL